MNWAWADTTLTYIKEDFESYNSTAAMRRFWTGGAAELEPFAPGGGKAALNDGADMSRHGGFSAGPDAGHNLVLSADLYDFATNAARRATVTLRGSSGHTFDMGLLPGANYALRVVGFSERTNWVSFKKSQPSVPGWHRFQAVLSLTNVEASLDLYADGTIDFTARIPFTDSPGQFTQLRFGGLSGRPSAGGPVLVDNLKLELVAVVNVANVATSPGNVQPPAVAKPMASTLQDTSTNYPAAAWWIFGALAVIIGLLAGLLLILKRSWPAKAQALLPLTAGSGGVDLAAGEKSVEDWRRRAITAEAIAVRQAEILQEKVGPELAQVAKQALVQGLYHQRNALIETQRKAEQALAELEQRLAELHLPVSGRIQAYEQRIAELEKELQSRGEEMRELIQATLLLVREKLDQERERSRPRFN